MKTDVLIENLAADLRPVRPLPGSTCRTIYWLTPLLLVSVSLLLGLARSDTSETLNIWSERWEMGIAALTAVSAAFGAFSASKPGRPLWISYVPVPFLAAWLSLLAVGLWSEMPGHPLSVLDFMPARSCVLLLITFSLLPITTLTVMLRRAAPLLARRSAILAGLASASFAVVLLRLVLFHAPTLMPEMMTEHVGSLIILGIVTGAFYKVLLPRRSSCPGEY